MNRRIKQVWLLAILSSFLLIGLQTYWLYNMTYSMGEMGKKNAEKAEQAIVTNQTNIGAAVKEKSHIGYVVTAYFSDYKRPVTTVCSPLDTDTIIGGVVYSKPGFSNVMQKRDTFDLRETDSNNSFDCLNTYITYQLTHFDKAHFDRFISKKLGNDFIGAEMKTGKHRLWQTRIVEPPTLFHHEMLVEVPFNPIQYQSMQMRMQVPMLPILKGMMWQMIGSLLVTIMLLLSIAYLIKVMFLQKKVDKMRSDFVHTPLQITSFDIHAALLNLVAVYRKNRQKEVNVSLDYQRTSDLMMGDRDQLLNVVSNLMENSVKYSGDIVNIHVAEEFPAAAWLRCDLCRQWQEGMGTVPGGEARPGIARHQYAGDGWL